MAEEYSPFDDDDGESMDLDTPTTASAPTPAQAYQQQDANASAWAQNPALQQYYAQYYSDPRYQQTQQTQQTQAQAQAAYAASFQPGVNGQPTYAQYASMSQQTAYLTTEPYQTQAKPQPHVHHQFQYTYNQPTTTPTTTTTTTTTTQKDKLKFKLQGPKKVPTTIKAFQDPPPPPPPSPSPPPPPSPPAQKKKKKEENDMWPPALRKYVERAFEACKTQEERIATESYLKGKIGETMQSETVWSYDWDCEPLPLERVNSGEKRKRGQTPKKKGKKEIEKIEKPKKKKQHLFDYSIESEEERRKISQRANRFKECTRKPSFMGRSLENTTIIRGTCTNLEKKYLRLTTAADPSLVRPERVLKESVEMIKRKWKGREVDYLYVCEQFKSIRQDLTVQHIKNAFTVKVYEMHGRLAIENGDVGEYNQCQTQLTVLYASGIPGNRAEFTAYAILYFSLKDNQEALGSYLKKIPLELRSDPSVKYALDTHRAYTTRNFYRFFKLLKTTPHLNSHLISLFLDKLRLQGMNSLISACKPTIPIDYLKNYLNFESNKACIHWLRSHGGVVARDGGGLVTKESKLRGLVSDKVGSTKIV